MRAFTKIYTFLRDKKVLFLGKLVTICLCVTYLVIWTACGSDAIEMFDCSVITPTYNLNIKPILDTSCAKSGCHDAQTNQSGFDLSSYSKAKSLSQQKAFLGSIQQKSSYPAMPNDGVKLSDDKIKLLSCWVQNGSPE